MSELIQNLSKPPPIYPNHYGVVDNFEALYSSSYQPSGGCFYSNPIRCTPSPQKITSDSDLSMTGTTGHSVQVPIKQEPTERECEGNSFPYP